MSLSLAKRSSTVVATSKDSGFSAVSAAKGIKIHSYPSFEPTYMRDERHVEGLWLPKRRGLHSCHSQPQPKQGSYRSWKTWKVMEFKNFISRPGKSWNLIVGPWKSWKIQVLVDRLFTADDNAMTKRGVINPLTPKPVVTGRDEPRPFFHFRRHHFWPKLASSIVNFCRRKRCFQWCPGQSDWPYGARDMHKNAQKVEWKSWSKISCHYTWLLHGQICPSQWRFFGSIFNCKQAQQKANHCSKNKRKGEKGKANKKPKDVVYFLVQPRPQGSLLSCAGNQDPWPGPTTFRFWMALLTQ